MKLCFSDQYMVMCVVSKKGEDVDDVIAMCKSVNAFRQTDEMEFCVELKPDIGPELWTEESLRRSLA